MTEKTITIPNLVAADAILYILNATQGEFTKSGHLSRAGELRITGKSLDQLYAIAERIYEVNPHLRAN